MFRPRVENLDVVSHNDKETTLELYSHANTSVLGNGALVVADFNEPVNVKGYNPVLGTKNYQTITGAVGYCDPLTRNILYLVIHHAIYIPTLDHHLLCPIQCCVVGVDINGCPKFLTTLSQENFHFIIAKYEYEARTVLPLALQVTTSVLNVLKITEEEWTRRYSPQIFLINKYLHWEPNSSIFRDQEHACNNIIGDPLPRPNGPGGQPLIIN